MMRCWRVKDSSAAIIPARRLWLRYASSKLFVVGMSLCPILKFVTIETILRSFLLSRAPHIVVSLAPCELPSYLLHLTAGLSYDTNEIALRDAFAEHGEVVEGK
ncbi:hypothetical protein GW17_00057510 [Ensete ventricosum]|nr:hypothetical protein GW17_00057510 [Ensete ventricosum]